MPTRNKIFQYSVVLIISMMFCSSVTFAAAVAGRQAQMKQAQQAQVEAYKQAQEQAQAQAQGEAYQDAAAQQQAQEMRAYQQQLIMQQVVQEQINQEIYAYVQAQTIQAQQQEMVKGLVMQELANQMAQAQSQQIQKQMVNSAVARAVEQAATQQVINHTAQKQQQALGVQAAVVSQELAKRQEVVAARTIIEVAETQKMTALRNQVILQNAATQKQYESAVANQLGQQPMAGLAQPFEQIKSDDVKDVVDISDVWKKLDTKAVAWTLLIDNQAKVMTVTEYIERFRKEGARMAQSSMYYAHTIDDMVVQNPQMLQMPFKELLQIAAVLDYDFDNGVSRDQLARKVLGNEANYQANKRRLGR